MTTLDMHPSTSLYLDLSRFLAAVIVLLTHAFQPPFHELFFSSLPARAAVTVFFVISGFVIAYVVSNKETGWPSYTVNRLSRIYSVALPALVVTGIVYSLTIHFDTKGIAEVFSHPEIRLLISLTFINHFWNLTATPLSNYPYWSLCFEVWYYVAFGLWCYAPKTSRYFFIAAIALLVGPRIVILSPLWIMGVVAYKVSAKVRPGSNLSKWMFPSSLFALFLALSGANPADAIALALREQLQDGYLVVNGYKLFIGGDWRAPSDYWIGAVFAMTVLSSPSYLRRISASTVATKWIRDLSSYTFSIYLYHFPLLLGFHIALAPFIKNSKYLLSAAVVSGTVLSIALLARLTEHRKEGYARIFGRVVRFVARLVLSQRNPHRSGR